VLRRSFRFGLTLGLLAGIAYALVRAVQSQREPAVAAPPRPWPPLEPEAPRSTPVAHGSHRAGSSAPPPPERPRPAPAPPAARPTSPPPASDPGPATPTPTPSAPPAPTAPAAPADRTATPPSTPPAPAAERVAPAASEAATRAVGKKAAQAPKAAKKAGQARKAAKKAGKARKAAKAQRSWVEPADGTCPTSHPVKAKLASKIFHLPGMLNYERTRPDRCYADADAATSDGLRPAKR
jgi:hypothetical protein